MKLTIDMETRSAIDLRKVGMYVYSEHPTTDVVCMAVKVDNERPVLWVPDKFKHLAGGLSLVTTDYVDLLVMDADVIEAHNAGFERAMWRNVMEERHGFMPLPLSKVQCSAAKARYYALPGALDKVTDTLRLKNRKDSEGKKLMLKMCKPVNKDWNNPVWHEAPNDFVRLCQYCLQDTEAEYELSETLPAIPKNEMEVWRLDQEINDRGVCVDLPAIDHLLSVVKTYETRLLIEMDKLTGGRVKSPRQLMKMLMWSFDEGVVMDDMKKDSVEHALSYGGLPDHVARVFDIRKSLAKSSVSKLDAMKRYACRDGRVRGTLVYGGATTLRWTAKGVQVHNFPRDSFDEETVNKIVSMPLDDIIKSYGCPIVAASKCLRGMIIAGPSKKLMAADYSAIEARVLAWLAGEKWVIKAYEEGTDIYKVNAAAIYGGRTDAVTKEQRQIGKVCELALGYQGHVGAFQSMAKNYGVKLDDELVQKIVTKWRANRPLTVQLWKQLEQAALNALRKPGQTFSVSFVKFGVRGKFLHCRLPSGRFLTYPFARVGKITTKFGQEKEVIKYISEDSEGHASVELAAYGGSLTENIVQAISRDLLASAMLRLKALSFNTIFHVHDENIVEVWEDQAEMRETVYENAMKKVPDWAAGCPINAEAWTGKRYRK